MNINNSENEHLAASLKLVKEVAKENVVKSNSLNRSTRELLVRAGYLSEVIRGWYIITQPEGHGTTTLWYYNFWNFLKYYLEDRFGSDGYCLSSESTVDLFVDQNYIPQQVVVLTKSKTNTTVSLPHETSLLLYKESDFPTEFEKFEGLNLKKPANAVVSLQPSYYNKKPLNAQMALKLISAESLSRELIRLKSVAGASRVVEACRAINMVEKAKRIENDLMAIGIKLKKERPFKNQKIIFNSDMKADSPSALRVEGLLNKMRTQIIENYNVENKDRKSIEEVLKEVESLYTEDAYNSLSIEGYQVTEELIKKIAEHSYDPSKINEDVQHNNAMAARGYYDSFKLVCESLKKVYIGKTPGQVFYEDLQSWYRALFKPMAEAGLLRFEDLAGYRNQPVYIKGSAHVPPRSSSVGDCMHVLEDFLKNESNSFVCAVLGHFFIGYIHPYIDGNGRIGRFLMNLNLISGGHNWTVVSSNKREDYLNSLEKASSDYDIRPFTDFILEEMKMFD